MAIQNESNLKKLIFAIIGWPNFLRRLQWPTIRRMLDTHDNHTVLDLGAGQMRYSVSIARRNDAFVIAVDLLFNARDLDSVTGENVLPVRADAQHVPLPDGSVDRILMSSLLHMVPEPSAILRECRRLLKDGGYVVLSIPNHYQYIPKIMKSTAWPTLSRLLRLPRTNANLVRQLNERFHVGGPQGYYSKVELAALLRTAEFEIADHVYAPGRFGSFLWELSVLGFLRIGNLSFYLLFLAYPVARILELFNGESAGSEHIIKVVPIHGR